MPREQQATMEYLALQAGAEESDIIKDRLLSNSFQFNLLLIIEAIWKIHKP